MPKTAVNSALQGKGENATITALSFAINSLTLGLVDLMEGEEKPEPEDFGQTLASAGIQEGPYLVAPFLGSHTGRSLVGWGVDFITNPYGQLTAGAPNSVRTASIPVSVTSIRATYFDAINDVKYNNVKVEHQIKRTNSKFIDELFNISNMKNLSSSFTNSLVILLILVVLQRIIDVS